MEKPTSKKAAAKKSTKSGLTGKPAEFRATFTRRRELRGKLLDFLEKAHPNTTFIGLPKSAVVALSLETLGFIRAAEIVIACAGERDTSKRIVDVVPDVDVFAQCVFATVSNRGFHILIGNVPTGASTTLADVIIAIAPAQRKP